MSIQPLILLTPILLVKLCWKWLPDYAISHWYPLASWNIQGHTEVRPFRIFVGGQHKFEGCHLEFGAVLPKTLLLEFYIKLENSWKHTMDRLSLVTRFILGEKTVVTTLDCQSVVTWYLHCWDFTENAPCASCPRSAQEPVKMCLPSAPGTEAPNSCTIKEPPNASGLSVAGRVALSLWRWSVCWDSLLLATAKHSSWRCSGGVYLTWSLKYERQLSKSALDWMPPHSRHWTPTCLEKFSVVAQ